MELRGGANGQWLGAGWELLGDRGGFQKLGGLVRGLAWPRAGERRLRKGPAATMPRGVGIAQLCLLVLALPGWTRSK